MKALIHGDNQTASYKFREDLKKEFAGEVNIFQAKELTPVSLAENQSSQSLFQTNQLLIIENPSANKKLFQDTNITSDLILHENKRLLPAELTTFQKLFPQLTVHEFKISPIVFKFLESIMPGNQKAMIPLWREYVSNEEPEVALAMLARQCRLLLGSEEFEKLPPWQKQKINSQAKRFSIDSLIKFHEELLIADFKNKTGQNSIGLEVSLELLLAKL